MAALEPPPGPVQAGTHVLLYYESTPLATDIGKSKPPARTARSRRLLAWPARAAALSRRPLAPPARAARSRRPLAPPAS